MRIILAGIVGRYPWGGVTWCSLMYLLGLRALGHDVYYLEDTCECNYDPDENTIAVEPTYALRYINDSFKPFGFGDRWCYVDHLGNHHGMSRDRFDAICRRTDLFLVLSGGCWAWRERYRSIPIKAFIDSDPGFTQLALGKALGEMPDNDRAAWYVNFFRGYDVHFTFGSNIGTPRSTIPTAGFDWKHTWQPVSTQYWKSEATLPSRTVWTTVMTWQIKSFTDIGGNKDQEFLKVLHLAKQAKPVRIELAVNGPRDFLRDNGWSCVDAYPASRDLWRYHQYLTSSRGEFSVAKHTYVTTNSGWFSDRTECYLAAGRPAVVQDTGFSANLPTGEGLFAWKTPEEALEFLRRAEVDHDYHSKKAAELAREHFDNKIVLNRLLSQLPI